MANKKKTNTKRKGKSKAEVVPDFCKMYCDSSVELSLYERKKGGYSVKFTFCNAFVLYAKVVELDEEERAFISYPSWKNKDGEYVNFAYCFDKDIMGQMNDDITDFIYSD